MIVLLKISVATVKILADETESSQVSLPLA
jgi:hypothetical protein